MSEAVRKNINEMIKYRDVYSMLTNVTKDPGDCSHNFPIYYVTLSYTKSLDEYMQPPILSFKRDLAMVSHLNDALSLKPGQYVRHCDTTRWYSKLKYMSRDQTANLLTGMAYYGMESDIRCLYLELKSRNFLHWNTEESDPPYTVKFPDLTSPTQLGLFIRTLPELKYLKFILPILDLDLLVGSYTSSRRWDSGIKQWPQLLAVEKLGSLNFVTRLAIRILKKDASKVATLIEKAYTVGSLQIPPLGLLLRKGFEKWSKNE